MVVHAATATQLPTTARSGDVDLRASLSVRAGSLEWIAPDVVTEWHHHPLHEIEHARRGVVEVETADGRYLLPPIARLDDSPTDQADDHFRTLVRLALDDAAGDGRSTLVTTSDPVLAAIMDETRAHLATATARTVSRAVGMSERTMRRRFRGSLGMAWSTCLLHARMLRSMALLVDTERAVIDIAIAVGFDSPGGFNRAFKGFAGMTPSAYRQANATR
ncbi:MAG: AraC family transcriptional regulator [Ilumatobacteraceae bacterium]